MEKSIILEATEENIRLWVDGARMRPDEISLYARESREISEIFAKTAELLETLFPAESSTDAPEAESNAPDAEALPEDGEPWDDMGPDAGGPDAVEPEDGGWQNADPESGFREDSDAPEDGENAGDIGAEDPDESAEDGE